MIFRQLFDRESCTYTYLLGDESTREAVLIDPVVELVERDLQFLDELDLKLVATLDTHVHADHVTAASALAERTGCQTIYPAGSGATGAVREVGHGEVLQFGSIAIEVRETPGHTGSSVTYVVHDQGMAFTGDTLLIRGCGRTDFQEGSATTLYHSVHEQVFSLPDDTRLFPGHDYKGRTVTTVAEEKQYNPRLGGGKTIGDFILIMDALDLSYPKKIDVAVPANLQLGKSLDPWETLKRNEAGALQASITWVEDNAANVRLVDVRNPDEFEGPLGHLDNAELVPLMELVHNAEGWDRDQPIVTICRSGGRSDRAALELEKMGFARVASMTGGMLAVNHTTADAACG